MDAPANLVSLPSPAGRPPMPGSSATSLPPVGAPSAAGNGAARVSVERDRVVVERLVLVDASLAAFVAERPAEERARRRRARPQDRPERPHGRRRDR